MIQFIGVTKIYPSQPKPIMALDSVSFEISTGEFVFIVGPSGSGKTSILRHIIREELPDSGRIYFADEDITKLKQNGVYKLRRQIGTVFQDFKLIEEKNAYENIAFAMEAAGIKRSEINETVPYLLDIVNLKDRGDAFPSQLSGGEKQRVAIARAIANNPKVLIADEPTGNLDPNAAWDVVQVLNKVNNWGTTVIMSTHGSEIVNSLQKRVLRMENGKLVGDDKKGGYDQADQYSINDTKNKKKSITTDISERIKLLFKSGEEEENQEIETTKPEPEIKAEEKVEKVVETSAVQETLEKADVADIALLKIGKKLESKLIELGYKDVEDILSAGIAKVNEGLSKQEIKQLAKAIKRFLTTE